MGLGFFKSMLCPFQARVLTYGVHGTLYQIDVLRGFTGNDKNDMEFFKDAKLFLKKGVFKLRQSEARGGEATDSIFLDVNSIVDSKNGNGEKQYKWRLMNSISSDDWLTVDLKKNELEWNLQIDGETIMNFVTSRK